MERGLELHHIGVRFGGLTALDDVSLRVPPGRVVGVIGPNGAGKTTLFNVICGFVAPGDGLAHPRRSAAAAAAAPADPARHRPHPAGRRALRRADRAGERDGRRHPHRPGRLRRRRCSACRRSDRDERRLRGRGPGRCSTSWASPSTPTPRPATLPYAVRKRVALARALAARPRLLLLDEPAGGLGARRHRRAGRADPAAAPARDDRCAVLLVEHHMDLVMAVCDEIVVLDFGRVIAAGTPDEIRDDPAVDRGYLGADASRTRAASE